MPVIFTLKCDKAVVVVLKHVKLEDENYAGTSVVCEAISERFFYFGIILYLQKSYRDSAETCCMPTTQCLLSLTACITMVHLFVLRTQHQHLTVD